MSLILREDSEAAGEGVVGFFFWVSMSLIFPFRREKRQSVVGGGEVATFLA